jgi:alkylhydroperoxidase/carboxymuconolactone decarboxylase family protein YurZ
MSLKSVTPDALLDPPSTPSPSLRRADVYATPPNEILKRGEMFFDNVYGKISKRIMGQMERCGTEDLGIVAKLMYGYLLSNTRILSAAETSYVLIAGLVPQDVNPQLRGHLKGALSNGATVEEVRATREMALRICQAVGMEILPAGQLGGFGWREEVANI